VTCIPKMSPTIELRSGGRRIAQGTTLPPPGRGGTHCLQPLPPFGCNPMMEAGRIPPPCRKTRAATQRLIRIGRWQRPCDRQGGAARQAPPHPPPLGGCGCGCGAEDEQGSGQWQQWWPTDPNMMKTTAWPLGGDSNCHHCRPQ
jgi:hypothetical protein